MTELVEDIDHGWNQIVIDAKTRDREDIAVDVGIIEEEAQEQHADSQLTNAEVGMFHEFGTVNVWERSFIRATIDEKHNQIARLFARLSKAMIDRKANQAKGLGLIGEQVISWIKARIRSSIPPPLTPSTIKQKTVGGKKGTVPLIDTGQLIGSLTHAVRGVEEGDR